MPIRRTGCIRGAWRSGALLLGLLGLLCLTWTLAARAEPAGRYDLVAVRRLAGVAGPLEQQTGGGAGFPPHLAFGPGGGGCTAAPLPQPPVSLADPILADTAWGLKPGTARGWHVRCGQAQALALAEVDGRVLVAVSPGGTRVGLYEAPLGRKRIARLQAVLRDRKFLDGAAPGELDARTLSGIGFYLDYLGVPYRFHRPVLTTALLRELSDPGD